MSDTFPPAPEASQQATVREVVYVEAPKKKRGLFKKLLIGVGLLIALAVVASIASGNDEGTAGSSDNNSSVSDSGSTSSRTPIAYEQIVADTESMTDLQFDQYADDVKKNNRASRWTATVTEVDDQVFGNGFYAHLTVDPGEAFDFHDISIDISEEVALGLNLGDELVLSGEISDLTNTLDLLIVDLENVTIHN